jgi:hypothetical protein
VYFTLITRDNREREQLFPGEYKLLLSRKLLMQRNFHINILDHNGIVSEHNTFFPWELDAAVEALRGSSSNEVVFHDVISMDHLCAVARQPHLESVQDTIAWLEHGGLQKLLPARPLTSKAAIDHTTPPMFIFTQEDHWTGDPTLRPPCSSMAWLRMMARVARLHPVPRSKSELKKQLERRGAELCTRRHDQDLDLLRQWKRSSPHRR